ncbi:MBL fold metallo-hydrolase [Phytomonospora sp. NPDC050363]|uniref:MBL fold metallo-hydrolase n=1 Tax=Phytomonospora sp. NPDC050363 TaxID=3155642 RepID=UPI0033CAFA5B
MRMVKYTHACVRFEKDAVLVVDPGCWSEPEALSQVSAILVTHEHNDHVDERLVAEAVAANPELRIFGPGQALAPLAGLGARVTPVETGESFEAAGFRIRAFGGRHADVWDGRPGVANLGYLIEDAVYVPGDSLEPPGVEVETLFVPLQASWMKLAEAIAFARAVAPRRAHPIHDGQMHDRGHGSADHWLTRESGADYSRQPIGVAFGLS